MVHATLAVWRRARGSRCHHMPLGRDLRWAKARLHAMQKARRRSGTAEAFPALYALEASMVLGWHCGSTNPY